MDSHLSFILFYLNICSLFLLNLSRFLSLRMEIGCILATALGVAGLLFQGLCSLFLGNIHLVLLKVERLCFLRIGFLVKEILQPQEFSFFLFLVLARFLFFFLLIKLIAFFSFLIVILNDRVLVQVCEFCQWAGIQDLDDNIIHFNTNYFHPYTINHHLKLFPSLGLFCFLFRVFII